MRSSVKSCAVRALGVLATAAVSLVLAAPTALAADDATKKSVVPESTTCTNKLVKRGSSKARISVSGYSYVDADIGSAKIQTSRVAAKVTSCTGTSDNPVATSKITVTMKWIVTSTGIGSCSFGLPSGVSCTIDGKQVIIKRKFTCKNTSTCAKNFDSNLRPKPRQGYKILNVTYEARATGKQSGKPTVATETDWVTAWG